MIPPPALINGMFTYGQSDEPLFTDEDEEEELSEEEEDTEEDFDDLENDHSMMLEELQQ